MFQYPYGDSQQLNLDWLMEQWQETKASIDGSLQGEIDRVEAAITDLLTARDQAVAAQTAAETAATSAAGYAGTASGAASTATAQATAAAGSAALAGTHASNAQTSETNAGLQATAAANSAAAAAVSKTNAGNSETAAAASSSAAAGNALYAEGMAKGTQNGTPVASGSPYYEDNAAYWAGEAQGHASNAVAAAYYSEAMAKGTMDGTPVSSGEPGYEDNAEYYKDQAAAQAAAAAASAASADGAAAQAMIAALEASSTASADHPEGSYFRLNGVLYIATEDIDTGDTITPGTNCIVAVLGNDVSTLKDNLSKVEGISIEGYEWSNEEQTGNYIQGYICNNNGGQTALANFSNTEYAVNEGDECYITGTGNPAFVVIDTSNNVIYKYQPGANVTITNYKYIAPANTAKIFVNRRYQRPMLKILTPFKFVPSAGNTNIIGRKIGNTLYNAGKTFVNEIDLTGSSNKSVTYRNLLYNNAAFKAVNDDISPVRFLNANYAGANHGYQFGYKCTSASHGLLDADIGKTYSDGTNTWVLIKIDDADTFEIVCLDGLVWWNAKTATVPASVNFGTAITVTTSSLIQIRPSIKNFKTEILENNSEIFRISESYDIIDLGTALTNLMQNVGNNTNDSLVELADSVCSVNNVYDINEYGAITIYTQIDILKAVTLDEYAGTQCQAFAATTDLFAVLGTTFPTLQTSIKSATPARWSDANKAPSVFIKASTDKAKAFVVAFINDRTDLIANTAGEVDSSTLKLYPYLVNKQANTVRSYGNIAIRIPIAKNAAGADYVGYATVGNDIYYFIGLLSAKTVRVYPDANVFGKTITVVEANSITVSNTQVINSIDVTSTGEGYCLLKIS